MLSDIFSVRLPVNKLLFLIGILLIQSISPVSAVVTNPDYLLDMDIEDLMAVEVTSVFKYSQPLSDTPAAITVINSDDIKRSGLTQIPEILRLAPGMQVIRTSEAYWNVSARSFPFEGQRKMLVISDGRSIFSQDTGTVNWETLNFIPEDIEKIEVIRGPGGTTWGYNAVNGVVNIISKKPEDVQGLMTQLNLGSFGNKIFQTRFGGKLSQNTFYKLYFTNFAQENFEFEDGFVSGDGLEKYKGGFRIDFKPFEKDEFSIEGAVSRMDYELFDDYSDKYDEKFIKGIWNHSISDAINLQILSHYDESTIDYGRTPIGEAFSIDIKQFNTEAQLEFYLGEKHHVMVGAGFKTTKFTASDGYQIDFLKSKATWDNYNFFISDEFSLIKDKLVLTLGTKVEHNTNTDYGWQPNARILYKPDEDQSLWAAVSRALRSPDFRDSATRIVQSDVFVDPGIIITYFDYYTGTPLKDEKVMAYEAGYRYRIKKNISSEVAVFLNDYENNIYNQFIMNDPTHYTVVNSYDNTLVTYGFELSASWQVSESLKLMGSYSYLVNDYDYLISSSHFSDHSASSRLQLSTHYDASDRIGLNAHIYWNDSYEVFGTTIPEYLRLDLGMTFQISEAVEMSLNAQNLLSSKHREYEDRYSFFYSPEIPRNIAVNLKVMF